MSTKDLIIRALEQEKGEFISGEKLAGDLGLSRNAIWKAVKKENNSLYVGNKKFCGMLTEAFSDLETGVYSRFIVGIGIRADILEKRKDSLPSKNQVIAALIARFAEL